MPKLPSFPFPTPGPPTGTKLMVAGAALDVGVALVTVAATEAAYTVGTIVAVVADVAVAVPFAWRWCNGGGVRCRDTAAVC